MPFLFFVGREDQIGIYRCEVFISCVRTRNEPKKASGGGIVRKVFRYCGF